MKRITISVLAVALGALLYFAGFATGGGFDEDAPADERTPLQIARAERCEEAKAHVTIAYERSTGSRDSRAVIQYAERDRAEHCPGYSR